MLKDKEITHDILEDLYRIRRMIRYHSIQDNISKDCEDILTMAINNSIKFIENEIGRKI